MENLQITVIAVAIFNIFFVCIIFYFFRKIDIYRLRQDAFLRNIGDGVIALDKRLTITLFNAAASQLTEFSTADALGKPIQGLIKLINEKNEAENIIFLGEPLIFGRTVHLSQNVQLITKTGKKIAVGISAAPIIESNGASSGVIVVLRDVSRERELIKMKDEFVSLASHELRTPMTSIDGYVDMIMEGRYGNVSKNLLEPLGYIAQSTERLIRLVNDLLDVGRIETGRTTFNPKQVDLGKLTAKIVQGLQPIAQKKLLKLNINTKRGVKVHVDSDKCEQIINNLIGNALKFTDKGKVTVSVKNKDKFGLVEIEDTGVGISKIEQNKLFVKFHQIGNYAGRPPGTGLGLYISKQIAQEMGGDVYLVSSKPSVGSKFAIKLPLI